MKIRFVLPLLALAAGAAFAAEEAAPPRPPLHLWGAVTRVSVDANGQVTGVETPGDYSQAIRDALEAQARKLHYEAPVIDGRAVPGETWVQISACTAQEGGAYRLALRYLGNGPALASQDPPVFPRAAMRGSINAKYELVIDVAPDGSATISRANAVLAPAHNARDFERGLADWVKTMRFHVESVDGKPVGGQVTQKVSFVSDGGTTSYGSVAQAQKRANEKSAQAALAQAQASDTCELALKAHDHDENRQVAVGSPIKVSEAN